MALKVRILPASG